MDSIKPSSVKRDTPGLMDKLSNFYSVQLPEFGVPSTPLVMVQFTYFLLKYIIEMKRLISEQYR